MDYVDVVFSHRPDYDTPLEETIKAFSWLIKVLLFTGVHQNGLHQELHKRLNYAINLIYINL
jgi:aryl-alcohol dehydrogenase-like predicted oxidoreductase